MLKFTPDHEWLDPTGDDVAVGITEHAASELGDIVFIELPTVGDSVSKGDEVVAIDSTKAASGITAAIDGVITAVNETLVDAPESVNADPMGTWFFRIDPTDPAQLDDLLDEAAYQALIG
ncbi:glycine cleavage system H protein [Tessaracoccus bendigoensis DSM 12906]|uniref:Glycine cleavage system H protein n=1 Tax=Tessaracoccus bendigoensis DSM 12906 TaxID=1123357 RepID=A0A1M6KSX4_9ACTN|nr:glycine cleavage system H protein [Tessaracoccus bendigoensis]SHJ62061.1 glycine cleavage system H protein [Tessaracoccus bendigoensis DSM 12906]